MTPERCTCGSVEPPRRHGTVGATWLDRVGGRTVEVVGRLPRMRCRDCGRTRMVTGPDMHPRRLLTARFVDAVVVQALESTNVEVAAMHGVSRQVVAALVAERLEEVVTADQPNEIALACPGGESGGALVACDPWTGKVVDAYDGVRDPRLRMRADMTPGLVVHAGWSVAPQVRVALGGSCEVRLHPATRLGWLQRTLPDCARAFLSGLPRRQAPGMRAALDLAARQPMALSIAQAAELRAAVSRMPEVGRFAAARADLAQALGYRLGPDARDAYARWRGVLDPCLARSFLPVTGPLERMGSMVFGDGTALPDELWAATQRTTLPGLAQGRAAKAMLRHVLHRSMVEPSPSSAMH